MARIPGISKGGLLTRLALWFSRRKIGRLIEPIQIHAHQPRLLRALGSMEMGQEAARTVEARLKALAQVKAAQNVGCPF